MRYFSIFLLCLLLLSTTACVDRHVAIEEGKSFCSKWKSNPSGLALAHHDQKVYVSDSDGERILIISTVSMRVEKIIVTQNPNYDIVASPDGQRVYVLSNAKQESYMLVIETASDKIIESVLLGSGFAKKIMINQDRTAAFIQWKDKTTIINLSDKSQHTLRDEMVAPTGSFIQIKPYVAFRYLDAYDINTRQPTLKISKNDEVSFLATSPDHSLFVAIDDGIVNHTPSQLIFLDGKDFTTRATIPVGRYPYQSTFSRNGKKLYVEGVRPVWKSEYSVMDEMAGQLAQNITIIDVPTLTIDTVVSSKGVIGPSRISDDGKRIYFLNLQKIDDPERLLIKMAISIIDTEKGRIINEIPITPPETLQERSCSQ